MMLFLLFVCCMCVVVLGAVTFSDGPHVWRKKRYESRGRVLSDDRKNDTINLCDLDGSDD